MTIQRIYKCEKSVLLLGDGRTAGVQLQAVEGGLSAAMPGELCDSTAQHLVKFDTLNPYTYDQKSLTVHNKVWV